MAVGTDKLQEFAQQYPNTWFTGSAYHDESIEIARKRAADAGVADRISFEVASAAHFSGTGYDLPATFDYLHDMGDPLAAARYIRQVVPGTLHRAPGRPRLWGGTMSEAEPAVPVTGTNDRWRLDGRVALVTGASAGVGARFARVLHAAA